MICKHIVIAMLASMVASAARGAVGFDGDLVLIPAGCEAVGQCQLKNALRFTDPGAVVWEAKAGLVTDGASIPSVFQPFIGEPFAPSFIRAAVIHDYYCDRHVRPWRQTHRAFYDGLVAQGVPVRNAKVMYLAVLLGGPKWIELIPGNNCGKDCVNNFKTTQGTPGILARRADYSAKDIPLELSKLSKELEGNVEAQSLEQIDARAKLLRANDFYFQKGSQLKTDELGIVE